MRDDWDTYFMKIADLVSSRATCDRKHVGAVIVKDRRILATGYNGSIPGMPHCDDVGHMMDDGHCVRTIHAEVNAVAQAANMGTGVKGATMYCNTLPCWNCFKTIVSSGISEIVWQSDYPAEGKDRVLQAGKRLGVLRKFEPARRYRGHKIWVNRELRRVHDVIRQADGTLVVRLEAAGDDKTFPEVAFATDHALFEAYTDAVKARNYIASMKQEKSDKNE